MTSHAARNRHRRPRPSRKLNRPFLFLLMVGALAAGLLAGVFMALATMFPVLIWWAAGSAGAFALLTVVLLVYGP